jgi:hypothetical protein
MSEVSREYYGSYSVDDEDQLQSSDTLDERPDIDPYAMLSEYVDGPEVGGNRAGRLVAPDEGSHFDLEEELIAADVGIDAGAASAEEAAIHVVDDEPLELDDVN